MGTARHIRNFLKENRNRYFLGVLLLIAVDGLQLVMPKVLERFTDGLQEGALTEGEIVKYITVILAVAALILAGRFLWRIYIIGTSRRLSYWIRNRIFEHLEKLPTTFYDIGSTGDIMARATNDIEAVQRAFGFGLVMMVDAVFLGISTFLMMFFTINARLTLLALMPLPAIAVVVGMLGPNLQNRFKKVQEAFADLTETTRETVSGIRVVKSFVREEHRARVFDGANRRNYEINMKLIRLFGMFFPLIGALSAVSFIIALYAGGNMVLGGEATLGQLVAFLTYLGLLTWPMIAFGGVLNILQRGTASLKRINELLDQPAEEDEMDAGGAWPEGSDIRIKNLSFGYAGSDRPVIRNLSVEIKSGETLAVVGRTGSGKTTVAKLLLRLYEPPKDSIYIGGRDILEISKDEIRSNMAYMPQTGFLFSKSIRDNILFYQKGESEGDVRAAAERAGISDEIEALPSAYETLLGERGVNVSGGQRQRIAIARALVRKAPILILDDSLSAVDTITEEKILESIRMETKGKTAVIISHRISSIMDADKILVLEDGMAEAIGTHEQLMERGGLYRRLYQKQQLEEKLEGTGGGGKHEA